MSKEYFIRRAADKAVGEWEEVDEYLWNNHKYVLTETGERYYSDCRFSVFCGAIDLRQLGEIGPADLAIIARLVGVQPIPGAVPGGFVKRPPEMLRVKRGNGDLYYQAGTGKKYRLAA